ncbi:uncharacterized protein LOC127744389 isoform X1 [Arachis duranensis]|uniref:Uncharacterized protein LOC107465842 isoform X1 n=2 Tax=Arachis TaxID=3817 RepID=A0A6P5MX43_ARADU|nr:uncharacterized protein LOC107465842 isoform X1 [Arachis duranensis]XP_025619202.1 RNA-binding protein 42 isoform X1 [Arachis hypogaea]XP_052112541.1 uncharacterized protein LOC127744389 isoform X1 [Arachis duranensis]RYR38934.1 hypothetical protein Ahy_A09g044257 [Arachis hypogaea]
MAASSSSASQSHFTYSNAPTYFPVPFHLQQSAATPANYAAAVYAAAPAVQIPSLPVIGPVSPAPVSGVYSLPQYPSQQLFERDAQIITPEALESVKAAIASSEAENKAQAKKKAVPRKAAGQTWEDPILAEWPEDDYRLFCGDLGNEVNDDVLTKAFSRFPSFSMARLSSSLLIVHKSKYNSNFLTVVRDKRTGKTKGYGFVSFASPSDLAAALKEMNGKYVGNRPIKLSKSKWKERTDFEALEKQKRQTHKKPKLPRKGVLHK